MNSPEHGRGRHQNLFSHIWAATLFVAISSCADGNEISVSPGAYQDVKKCWTNNKGEFVAFVIISPQPQGDKLFYISARCTVDNIAYTNLGRYYQYIRMVMIEDPNKLIKKYLNLSNKTIDITTTDTGYPRDVDKVYYVVGRISKNVFGSNYRLSSLSKIENTGLSLSGLANLNDLERQKLIRKLN